MDDQNSHIGGSGQPSEPRVIGNKVDIGIVITRLKLELRIVVETIQSLERLESNIPLTGGDSFGIHLQPRKKAANVVES